MIAANTRAELLRGPVKEDALGDEYRDLEVVSERPFPMAIAEKSRREFDEASTTWRTVRYYAGRCTVRHEPEAGDVIRDTADGTLYNVSEVERMARGLSGRSSVTLTMKRA